MQTSLDEKMTRLTKELASSYFPVSVVLIGWTGLPTGTFVWLVRRIPECNKTLMANLIQNFVSAEDDPFP